MFKNSACRTINEKQDKVVKSKRAHKKPKNLENFEISQVKLTRT
jgi:hypothetical protein